MRITSSGKITEDFYVVGDPGAPVYLMNGDRPALFDAGFTSLVPIYERHIKKILGSRTPSYLFLTHSHFDHVGSAGYFKKLWPEMRIAGLHRIKEIMARARVSHIRDRAQKAGVDMGQHPNTGGNEITAL